MKDDLKISKKIIAKQLQDKYGIKIVDISFLPKGEDGVLYKVNNKYILKFAHIRSSNINIKLLKARLKFTRKLKEEHNLDFVVAPILTNSGEVMTLIKKHPVILFPMIESNLLEDKEITNQELKIIAKAVVKLHSLNDFSGLVSENAPGSDFAKELKNYLDNFNLVNKDKELSIIIEPWKDRLLKSIEHFQMLANNLRRDNLVVCHTDLSPGNLIFTPEGKLKIIDWDGVSLSLPEQDINLFSGEKYLTKFMTTYKQGLPKMKLDLNKFAYFKYRWDLEGVWQRVELLATRKISQEQRKHDLEELKDELDGHQYIKLGLKQIEAVL
jgi:thiamine kinase-like enzyme